LEGDDAKSSTNLGQMGYEAKQALQAMFRY